MYPFVDYVNKRPHGKSAAPLMRCPMLYDWMWYGVALRNYKIIPILDSFKVVVQVTIIILGLESTEILEPVLQTPTLPLEIILVIFIQTEPSYMLGRHSSCS